MLQFSVGEKVLVDWMGQGAWHAATVETVETVVNTTLLHVRYDDGHAEHYVPTHRVRPLLDHGGPPLPAAGEVHDGYAAGGHLPPPPAYIPVGVPTGYGPVASEVKM